MTIHDVADYLNCHPSTVYRLCQQRKFPGFRLGGDWRFLKSEIDEWIVKGGGQPSRNLA
jgi:excisionase family DNA binding protein